MVKMLAGSVMRTFFEGEMVIFRNSPQPLFLIQREGIAEMYVETPALEHQELANYSMAWKPKARAHIRHPERYDWVVFLDSDCLMLRNIDHLLDERPGVDILYQPEPGRYMTEGPFCAYLSPQEFTEATERQQSYNRLPRPVARRRQRRFSPAGKLHYGINSGTWAVRGHCYRRVMEEWDRIQESPPTAPGIWTEQGAWNRLILNAAALGLRAEPFEAHEIQFPLHLDKDWELYKDAAIVHCMGVNNLEKIEFMFGLYMQRFFHDPSCTMLSVLDT